MLKEEPNRAKKHFSLSKTEFQDALFETRCSAGMVELVVDNITYTVNGKVVVDGVSFSLCSGEILGVIGPNGAGKTTLLRLIAGILSPTRGRVLVDRIPLHSLPTRERARLGIARTFQHSELFKHMTVVENIMVGLEPW
ncbi:MAG TPA: ATP-binding cassette domain-containing protein, partial [Pyrodictiaceae archaeon]|nr:ATP-binding cassette domain-containing protein [Pyrodictiaceae archaeon]